MKTILNLMTLHGEKQKTRVIDGVKVTGMSGDGSLLSLLKLYRRREIPVH